jgi:hypothetical protein
MCPELGPTAREPPGSRVFVDAIPPLGYIPGAES